MKKHLARVHFMSYSLGMTIRVQSTAEINEVERELTFEFEYHPAEKGSRDYYGQQIEPDIHERLDFCTAYDEDGQEIETLFPEDIDTARNLALDEIYY